MQRARRLVAVVAVALAGSVVLAGCRSNPTVAAYVGDTEITEAEVTAVINNFNDKTAKTGATASPAPDQPQPQALTRVDVLTTMVLDTGCAQLSQEKGLKPTNTVTAAQFAQERQLPADSEYAAIAARLTTCMSGVPAAQVTPTEAELREVYDRAVALDMLQKPAQPFEQIKDALAQDQQLQQAFAAKGLYGAVAGTERVVVNPRYRPLTIELFADTHLMPLVIGGAASDAVTTA